MEIAQPIEDAPAAFEKAGGFVRMEGPQLVEPGFTDAEDQGRPLCIDGVVAIRVRTFTRTE